MLSIGKCLVSITLIAYKSRIGSLWQIVTFLCNRVGIKILVDIQCYYTSNAAIIKIGFLTK